MDKNKMLIDATHPEETRVVAVRNGRVEDFDFESAARKLLRGNIYLAKVTRVEPSLQAAFIDYGGNRHGFLAFNEIHPDYYQIPVADREALKQEEAEAEQRAEAEADERAHSRGGPRRRRRSSRGERSRSLAEVRDDGGTSDEGALARDGDPSIEGADQDHDSGDSGAERSSERTTRRSLRHDRSSGDSLSSEADPMAEHGGLIDFAGDRDETQHSATVQDEGQASRDRDADDDGDDDAGDEQGGAVSEDDQVEQIATEDDALEELPERPRRRARQYKIQEVIKRRQIMLVQVVKEERGNKGAALTTYISLAGRYTVLMPNTARGGGISRKITQPQDRKRLKAIAEELDVPEGMGLIIRTAGASRTKQEIKRDYEYLLRLWESVREVTLSSTAPCLVYEEGNIIKRAIRDLYSKEFDQIVVAGAAAHREAQDFMEMLMPGNGSHVAAYRDHEPLFARFGIERQLTALFSPYVTLRSGGYIVINQTEALVSVDVNSGKSTREFSIEETALNTNLEAAEEIARQLKLRDLAGLIVIDFIDMEEKRNNRSVERRLKDALRFDRARIQVGRISHFGLLEMSRQRLRAGVLEGSTSQCPHCQGTGIVRSIESVSLAVLRGIEDHLQKQVTSLSASTTAEVALYILNHKRPFIVELERRYGIVVRVEASDRMHGANFAIERFAAPAAQVHAPKAAVSMEWGFDRGEDGESVDADEEASNDNEQSLDVGSSDGASSREDERPGRRRRRRRGRRDRDGEAGENNGSHQRVNGEGAEADLARERSVHPDHNPQTVESDSDADLDADEDANRADAISGNAEGEGDKPRRGRRRGRRGGRSRRRDGQGDQPVASSSLDDADRNEWGVAEVAAQGSAETVDPAQSNWRQGIVETVEAQSESRHGSNEGFSASDAALQAAVSLAGGTLAEAKSPSQRMASQASAQADSHRAVLPPVPAPIKVAKPVSVAVPAAIEVTPAPVVEATRVLPEPEPAAVDEATSSMEQDSPRPQRKGWWQRRFGTAE